MNLRSAALLLFHPKQRVVFLPTRGTRCCGRVPGEHGCPCPPLPRGLGTRGRAKPRRSLCLMRALNLIYSRGKLMGVSFRR